MLVRALLTAVVVASTLPLAGAGPSASAASPPNVSTWYYSRPDLPPEGATLQTGDPTYVDEGSGTTATDPTTATDAPTPSALDTTGLITPAVRAFAQSLGDDPRAIFESVRNTFDYEPYYVGYVKGTQETLDAQAGNDIDLASLLVALLRSGGTPSRYVQRQIKVPADTAASWIGVQDPIAAARVLASGGLPVTVVLQSGRPTALMFDHVWVEAYVSDGGGKAWKSLDPSYKLHAVRPGRNVVAEAGLTGEQLRSELLAVADATGDTGTLRSMDLDAVNDIVRRRLNTVSSYVAGRPSLTMNDLVGGADIVTEQVTQLPTRPPYRGRGPTTRSDALADASKQKIRVRTYGLDTTLALPDMADKKLTVGFAPAGSADAQAITAAGGLLRVSPYSVNLKPQLLLDGQVVAQGSSAPIGAYAYLLVDFSRAGFSLGQSVHVVSFGGSYAIALDSQNVPVAKIERGRDRLVAARAAGAAVTSDAVLGEMANLLGLGYFRYNDLVSEYLSGSQNAVLAAGLSAHQPAGLRAAPTAPLDADRLTISR